MLAPALWQTILVAGKASQHIEIIYLFVSSKSPQRAARNIRRDWATCNPVSIMLRQNGLLEKEFARDGIRIVRVQPAGSRKAMWW